MKKQLTPYQKADELIKHDAIIDIANLIVSNEQLVEALKNIKKVINIAVLHRDITIRTAEDIDNIIKQAIKQAMA